MTTRRPAAAPLLAAALLAATFLPSCSEAPAGPAELDTKHEQCAFCRMGVSDRRFAAQVTAPGAQPKFFDDAGCLRDWLKEPTEMAPWTAWVSDHRTKTFVPAATAVFGKSPTVQTPMSSGILAWADAASRDADPGAAGATPLERAEVIGPLPSGTAP
jgi:copper chaperone NosL